MRLIDADYVSARLKPYEPSDEEWNVTGGTALRLIHNAIDNAPTVDAVTVVRCKDCKHHFYKYVDEEIGEIGGCKVFGCAITNNDFCSYGERKDKADAEG